MGRHSKRRGVLAVGAGATTVVTGLIALTATASGAVDPVAQNDSYNVTKNVTKHVNAPGVLANDSDADGDSLRAILVSQPTGGGSVALNADGSFTFVPMPGYTGDSVWTYAACPTSLTAERALQVIPSGCDGATVTMHVGPAGPPAPPPGLRLTTCADLRLRLGDKLPVLVKDLRPGIQPTPRQLDLIDPERDGWACGVPPVSTMTVASPPPSTVAVQPPAERDVIVVPGQPPSAGQSVVPQYSLPVTH